MTKQQPENLWQRLGHMLARPFVTFYHRLRDARKTAPHQSFRLTRKRDKLKKPKLQGFLSFTTHVFKILWESKGLFSRFLLLYFVLSMLMIGIIQGNNLSTINSLIDTANSTSSSLTEPISRAFVVVTSSLGGSLNANLSEVQQFYMLALYIFAALVMIWLLRQRLAGKKVTVRDGLYSAGAPLLSLYALVLVGLLQLVPIALAMLGYSTAVSGGFLEGGMGTGLVAISVFLIAVLTLYFMMTTIFAFMIATIPGTYPLRAYKTAKKIVAGQRLRLLFRLLWLALVGTVIFYAILIPVAIIVNALNLNNSFVIPAFVQLVTGFEIMYATSYFYLLYRRMIDEPVSN